MSELLFASLAFGSGLIVGWIFLPEPAFVRSFFVRVGWAAPKA